MKRSLEIRQKMEKVKNKIDLLQEMGKAEEALKEFENYKSLKQELEMAEAFENEALEDFEGSELAGGAPVEKVDRNVVFNKLVLNKPLTSAEEKIAGEFMNAPGTPGQVEHTDEKGGYLVPEENLNTLKEFRRAKIALKDYCNVVSVNSFKGSMPMEVEATETLTNFEELNEIKESDINFSQVKWDVADYGDIIPVSNTLLKDLKINLMDYIGRRFAKKAVNTENKEILEILASIKKTAIKDWKGISTALNKTLDPAISSNAIVLTNQSGFDYLDNLTDGEGRPLLSDSLVDKTQKIFRGRPVVVVPDADLKNESTKVPYVVGDMTEFVSFFDRQGVEVAVSEHAGFTKNATLLRAIERFDVQKVDGKAMVYLQLDTASQAGA